MADTTSKPWYMSKTLWANVLMLVLTLLQSDLVLGFNIKPEIIAGVITVVNFVLRLLTTTAVTTTKT